MVDLVVGGKTVKNVKKYRGNILMMWFGYQNAFDSVPYDRIIKALELAKVPPNVTDAVKQLMKVWAR